MSTRDYPTDLLDLAAEADLTIECGCDPDEHDTITCRCGHRIVDHTHGATKGSCNRDGCYCRRLVRAKHRGNVPVGPWTRDVRALERRQALDGAA